MDLNQFSGAVLIIGGKTDPFDSQLIGIGLYDGRSTVSKFDPSSETVSTWEYGGLSVGRHSHVAGRWGNKIVVAGGVTASSNAFARNTEVFDLEKDDGFRQITAQMRQPRSKPIGAVVG